MSEASAAISRIRGKSGLQNKSRPTDQPVHAAGCGRRDPAAAVSSVKTADLMTVKRNRQGYMRFRQRFLMEF